MLGEIEVLRPGLFSTIQDLGRTGYLKYGVPTSGAMDSYAAKTGNLLVQNSANAAVLEITQLGPVLKFSAACRIAITGADLSPGINGQFIENNVVISITQGDELSFGRRISGCRAYLAVSGGFQTEELLGSRSWYEGISRYHRLEKGFKLHYIPSGEAAAEKHASLKVNSTYIAKEEIKVFPGPEFERLDEEQQNRLMSNRFKLGKNNNRMAIQLEEELRNDLKPIITGPVLPGTVQLTPSGKMIVLMRDCQTTGGYPRILQVSEAGVNILAQKVVGNEISFNLVRYKN